MVYLIMEILKVKNNQKDFHYKNIPLKSKKINRMGEIFHRAANPPQAMNDEGKRCVGN